MIDFITLEQAKSHSYIDGHANDIDVSFKISQASEIVLDYLKLSEIPEEWILNSSPMEYVVPAKVQAVTLLVFGELFENRESSTADVLSDRVVKMLERMRDPALA